MCNKCQTSMYRSIKEISSDAKMLIFDFRSKAVVLDKLDNGWYSLMTRIVSDRYSGDVGRVPNWVDGDYVYEKAIEILDNARKNR